MNPRQILLILQARYKIFLVVAIASIAIALPIIFLLPKQYTATTSLVVDIRSPDPISAVLMPPSNLATQEDIIMSDRVAQRVVKILKLDENPAVQQQWRDATSGKGRLEVWLAELLRNKLAVAPQRRDSSIIIIEYTAVDPRFAAAVANAYAQAYVDATIEMRVEPAKQYARWFGDQGNSLRENLEKAQARLSAYQRENGIVAKDETVDTETTRLSELTSQLTAVQGQTSDARSKQRSTATDTLPEVLQNSVVQGLRADIARQEGKLKDASGNLGKEHPLYLRMGAELAELKVKLDQETRHVASGFLASGSVGKDKEKELKAAIEAQKKKLLALMSQRDQLAVLQRDVDAAKNAYDTVSGRYTQANLESQATQTNVFLLSPAMEPLEPSRPKIPRYMAMAIFFSMLLGLAAAFGVEMLDRRIRCVDDMVEMLQIPLLAVVNPPKRPARLGLLRARLVAMLE
jgi:chain length determinant protein EpsF